MSNPTVRDLVASVSQDAQNETIDLVESFDSVTRKAAEIPDTGEARRQIIGWLNQVYFTQLILSLPTEWWWEMHTRIQKLIVVSMVIEGANLRSFGAVPQIDDIPQCLIELPTVLKNMRWKFPSLRKRYLEMAEELESDYLRLYTQ